jgi:hypothetical protein
MPNYTETTHTGWLSRIGNSFVGMLLGIVFTIGSVPLLWWNEGNAVRTSKGLAEGEKITVDAKADVIAPDLAGKLIHLTGHASGKDALQDTAFGVSLPGFLKLKRIVEQYQWVEEKSTRTRDKVGGGQETITEYSYQQKWDDEVHNSSNFKQSEGHQNPAPKFRSQEFISQNATLGAYKLPDFLLASWADLEQQPAPDPAKLPAEIKDSARITDGWLMLTAKPDAITTGDARVRYEGIAPGTASVLAAQSGETLAPFTTSQGTTIARIASGTKSKEEMFAAAKSEAAFLRWLLRGVGFFVMFFGLAMIMSPLKAIAKVIPFLGSIVGAAGGFVAFLLAICGSSLVIALAWVAYRPLISIPLLAITVGGIVWLFKSGRKAAA